MAFDGHAVWKLHRAVTFHLTQKKYDIILSNGSTVNSDEVYFNKLKSKGLYQSLSMRLNKPRDAVEFFIGNRIYSDKDESFTVNSWENYKQWINHKQALTKYISDDIDRVDLSDLHSDMVPSLLKDLVIGKVIPQTLCALDNKLLFLSEWQEKDYFGFGKVILKLIKLKPLIKYNVAVIENLINTKVSDREIY